MTLNIISLSLVLVQEGRAEQAGLQYQQSVLLALEEVENAIIGINQQWKRYRILQGAASSTQEAVQLVTTQYDAGITDFNNVLPHSEAFSVSRNNQW